MREEGQQGDFSWIKSPTVLPSKSFGISSMTQCAVKTLSPQGKAQDAQGFFALRMDVVEGTQPGSAAQVRRWKLSPAKSPGPGQANALLLF